MLNTSKSRIEEARVREVLWKRIEEEELKEIDRDAVRLAAWFVDEKEDIAARLDAFRQKILKLEDRSKEPALALMPGLWCRIGVGWYLAGDHKRAEVALLKADELGSQDVWVCDFLGRIYLDRQLLVQESLSSSCDGPVGGAKILAERASRYFERNRGRVFRNPIDSYLAELYVMVTGPNHEEVSDRALEGLRKFPKEARSEEFHALIGWILYRCRGDTENATKSFRAALELRPHYPWALFFLAKLTLEKRDVSEALRLANRVLHINPRMSTAHAIRAVILWELNRFEEAEKDVEACLVLDPDSARNWTVKGKLLEREGKYDSAIQSYSWALKLDPGHSTAWAFRGTLRLRHGEHELGLEDLAEALRIHPKYWPVYQIRGEYYLVRGDDARAFEDFDRAVALNPNGVELRDKRADQRMRLRLYSEAIEDLDVAIRYGGKYADLYRLYGNRGAAKANLRQVDEAIQDLTKSLSLKSDNSKVRFDLAMLMRIKKRWAEAASLFEEVARSMPDRGEAYYYSSESYLDDGRIDDAIRVVEWGLGRLPAVHSDRKRLTQWLEDLRNKRGS